MYAVIKTGGKQYRVAPDDVLTIEKLAGEPGDKIEFGDVLMYGADGDPQIGSPTLSGFSVSAEVVEQGRAEKIIIFKKKRRQNYRRRNGHRQYITTVRILDIFTGEERKAAAEKPKAKPKKQAADASSDAAEAKPKAARKSAPTSEE
ncbi:MAG: 50S ribosomal protein L21 [Hyphomicrobiales bacterium]|nr:50S ribosomal protein L21 [Hyphomicrobiales bacterium]